MKTYLALRAIAAAGRWNRLTQGHIPLGGLSCSCNVGFGSIAVADFEQDVLDYLYTKHGSADELKRIFLLAGHSNGSGGSVAGLLQVIAQNRTALPQTELLIADLEKSLESFEEIHGGTGSR